MFEARDEVEMRLKSNVIDALNSKNAQKLTELVSSLDISSAEQYIEAWQENYLQTMQKIRNSEDTTDLDYKTHEMVDELCTMVYPHGKSL